MKEFKYAPEGAYTDRSELRKARERAMIFLSYTDYTEKAMKEKLLDCDFDEETVDMVIGYLIDRKYIDERRHMKSLCTYFAEKKLWGKNKIYAALKTRGFSNEHMNEYFKELMCEFDFSEICCKIIKKTKNIDLDDKKSRDKLIASLCRKGFSLSEIKTAISLYSEGN